MTFKPGEDNPGVKVSAGRSGNEAGRPIGFQSISKKAARLLAKHADVLCAAALNKALNGDTAALCCVLNLISTAELVQARTRAAATK
jgi:hypothetical protein